VRRARDLSRDLRDPGDHTGCFGSIVDGGMWCHGHLDIVLSGCFLSLGRPHAFHRPTEDDPVDPAANGLLAPWDAPLSLVLLRDTRKVVPRKCVGCSEDPERDMVADDEDRNVGNAH
jgi:hypothetical protein